MPAPKPDPTLSAAKRADVVCDSFERAWRAGQRPSVEEYVAAVPAADRGAVRSALVKVEAELRSGQARGETSTGRAAEGTGSHRPIPSTPDTAAVPTHIGRFEVRAVLGAGAFGRVYRAFDPTLDREVAIKVPQPDTLKTDADRDRFLREARSAATVSHPNVCQIFEVGTHDGQPYIVMAMVPGQSLQEALRGRSEPLPERQAAIIVRKIALALDAAHKKGVVHRDLKPANVMFDRERKDFVVMDFGLARRSESGDVRATQSGAIMGTPAYMSPEQARGEARDVGPETDIFSLGVMLYEMLAGERPFKGASVHEVIGRIILMEPQPPSELRPGLDPLLAAACMKALAKDPAQRFASMAEFAAALDGFLYRPAAPGAETVRPTATKGGDDGSLTESRHLGNVFAKMTADEDEDEEDADATTATKRPTGGKRAAGPRWPVVAGVALGLVLVAAAGVVFFTRSGPVKASVELADIDLTDKSLSFLLDNKPVTADELSKPMELRPDKYTLVAQRDGAIVKRYYLKVTGGRRPGIEVEDITPKREAVQAPPKPVPAIPPVVEAKPKEPDNAELNKLHPVVFEGTPWTLAGDELVSNPQAKFGVAYFGSPDWSEYDLTFKFKLVGDKGYATARFHQTGIHPAVHSYRGLQFGAWGNSAKDLLNVLNGQWAGRDGGGFIRPGLVLDRWYDVYVIVRGEKAQVVLDNHKIFDGANEKYKSGRLAFDYAVNAEARIRDVEVKDPKGRVLWKGVSQLGVAAGAPLKKEPEPVVPPKKEPDPLPKMPDADDGFTPLFNGKDLTGWMAESGDGANWKVEGGAISVNVTEANRKESWLLSEKSYKDFVARFEFRAAGGTTNSGFALRAVPGERPAIGATNAPFAVPTHLQVELFSAGRATGSLLTIVTPPQQMAKSDPAGKQKPDGEWNEMEVESRGQNLKVRLNGTLILDCNLDDQVKQGSKFPGLTRAEGRIGFQRWGGAISFRNIRLKELTPAAPATADGLVPLFGKDLTGWEGLPGMWKLQGGALVGTSVPAITKNTYLYSRAQYADFELKFDVRLKGGVGNSGVQIRSAVTSEKDCVVAGPQVEIAANGFGGLYGEGIGGWMKQVPENIVSKVLKPNEFNSYHIRVVGNRVVIVVNGTTLVDDTFPAMADRGIIGFQFHLRRQPDELTFRNVLIRDLSAAPKPK